MIFLVHYNLDISKKYICKIFFYYYCRKLVHTHSLFAQFVCPFVSKTVYTAYQISEKYYKVNLKISNKHAKYNSLFYPLNCILVYLINLL